MVTGAVALAEFAHVVAAQVPGQHRAAHRPLPEGQARRLRAAADRDLPGAGRPRREAAVPVAHVGRLGGPAGGEPGDRRRAAGRVREGAHRSSRSRSASSAARRTASSARSTRSCTPRRRTRCAPSRRSALGERGRYLLAATFGNVHGVYKPGNVKLRPEILKEIQDAVAPEVTAGTKPFDLVFHGGSGSALEEIREALSYGVVKMNVDTDTQYAFTRPVADHMFSNYDGVLKIDGEVGNKKAYDPRTLRQGGRGRHGRAGRRGLRGPAVRRPPAQLSRETEPRDTAWNDRTCSAGRRPPTCSRDAEAHAALAAGEDPARWRRGPRPTARPGRRWPSGPGRPGRPGHRLRLRAHRLPPRPGPAAPRGLEGPRPGAVGARAEPRLPALPGRAGARGRGDRRERRGGALPRSSCGTAAPAAADVLGR